LAAAAPNFFFFFCFVHPFLHPPICNGFEFSSKSTHEESYLQPDRSPWMFFPNKQKPNQAKAQAKAKSQAKEIICIYCSL
jgi:hypothetical protein